MRTKAIWTALAILCAAVPASAEECNKPLKLIASLPMTDVGINSVTIPVSLDGVEKQFLLDTGGSFTQISRATADELKLRIREGLNQLTAEDGTTSQDEVFVPDFALGPLHGKDYKIPVSPIGGMDGIFSPVAFETVDFEMDFSTHKFNMFLNDHCDGKVVYWPSKAFGVVPFTLNDNHIVVPVTIDGHDVHAIIDTGQTYTTIFLNRATQAVFGLHPDSPDMKVVGHIGNNQNALIFAHPFKTMAFGDIAVSNPHIQVFTDVNASSRSFYRVPLPPVIIGMDVLRKLHLFLALKEGKLYLTEASTPATALVPAPATAPTNTPNSLSPQ